MKRCYVLLVGVLFLMAFAVTAIAAQVEEVEEASFPLSKEGLVSVESVAGDILIHSWDKEEVRMVATKWAKASSRREAEELLEALEIEISSVEDRLGIATKFPWWKRLSPLSSVKVDYELWVPLTAQVRAASISGSIQVEERGNSVSAKTTSGDIELKEIQGQIEADTTSGDIYVSQSEGNAVLHSTSGEIQAEQLVGDINVRTTSSAITLEEIEGIVEAHSTSGRINILDARGGAKSIKTISGSIWAEFEEVEETLSRMELHSTSGNVVLYLPRDIGANIEADTLSGRINIKFKVLVEGVMDKGAFRGTIGDGGILIKMHTISGDISLRKA